VKECPLAVKGKAGSGRVAVECGEVVARSNRRRDPHGGRIKRI
jgi:hypothetical protein